MTSRERCGSSSPRLVFNVCIGNTDDHLRNQRRVLGRSALAPHPCLRSHSAAPLGADRHPRHRPHSTGNATANPATAARWPLSSSFSAKEADQIIDHGFRRSRAAGRTQSTTLNSVRGRRRASWGASSSTRTFGTTSPERLYKPDV